MKLWIDLDGVSMELEQAWRIVRSRAGNATRLGTSADAERYARQARLLGTLRVVHQRVERDEFTRQEVTRLRNYLNRYLFDVAWPRRDIER